MDCCSFLFKFLSVTSSSIKNDLSFGINKIKNIKINKINNNRLIIIKLSNNKQIITTCNHLFATTEGWIEAKNLQKGDELFVQEKLYNMWENNEIQEENYQKDLFQDLSQLTYFAIRKDNKQFRIWSGIKETIISKNVNKQSNELKENYNQYETDQGILLSKALSQLLILKTHPKIFLLLMEDTKSVGLHTGNVNPAREIYP